MEGHNQTRMYSHTKQRFKKLGIELADLGLIKSVRVVRLIALVESVESGELVGLVGPSKSQHTKQQYMRHQALTSR